MKKKILLVGILSAFSFFGCTEDEIVKPSYYNTPVISKTTNAFVYTLWADYYIQTATYDFNFNSDSSAFSLIITNYFSGIGNLELKDTSGAIIYSETLQGNKVISFMQANQVIPKLLHVDFDRFRGKINIALVKSGVN